MKEEVIKRIIRYLSGESSDAEKKEMKIWKKKNPDLFSEIENIYINTPFESLEFEKADLAGLLNQHNLTNSIIRESSLKTGRALGLWIKIAASLLILISIGTAANYLFPKQHITENTSAHTLAIVLPDHSEVILDKGARFSYKTSLLGSFNRTVKIEGRGHFHITRNEEHPFIVRTSTADIKVLGTKFTVSAFDIRSQILLEEGKIEVFSKETNETILLSQSGEQIIISDRGVDKHNTVKSKLYMSWMKNRLEFNNCTVDDALEFLSDTWNLNVVLNDSVSGNIKLIGTAPSDDPELIMQAITLIINQESNINIIQ